MPSEPWNFSANVKSNTTVQLTWNVPVYPNGVIKGYRVYYKDTKDKNVFGLATMTETQYLVKSLKPYRKYSFWVYAKTSAGFGNKSATISAMTDEGGN